MPTSRSVIILLADGARPDVLGAAIKSRELPALAQLAEEGSVRTITTVFPSVTGPAYTPFLTGQHPGSVGLPGLRWYDRAHTACHWPSYARSYIGPQCRFLDRDLSRDADTMFELAESSVGALSVIRRGLDTPDRLGSGAAFVARTAITHFRGKVSGWLDIDRSIGARFVERMRRDRPEFAFAAFTGIDKASHAFGHDSAVVHEAMRVVDDACAQIRADAERGGRWDQTHLWIVSDHGHSRVSTHEDLAGVISALGFTVAAHPWIARLGAEVAVAVSGNSMAHVYTGLSNRTRSYWPALAAKWSSVVDALVARPSVDIILLPAGPGACQVRTRDRGDAIVSWDGGCYSYAPITGDPLGIGEQVRMTDTDAFDATFDSAYPDSIVQIERISSCARSGDIILSAAPDWDFRARYEPVRHVSSHGALHREHMLVPLITNRPIHGRARRTVDVMASACAALSITSTRGEGLSFL